MNLRIIIKQAMVLLSLMLAISACKNDSTGALGLEKRDFILTGTVTATFSGEPLANVQLQAEVLDTNFKSSTITNSNGYYSMSLSYFRDKYNPKSFFVIITATSPNIRFTRQTGFQAANVEGTASFNFDCIENYGDGIKFRLPIYNKLNIGKSGSAEPTYRWYPKFPDVYVVRTPQVSNRQYQMVIDGIKKISEMSRGKIPYLNVYTVPEESLNILHNNIVHEWVKPNQLPDEICAATGNSFTLSNFFNNSVIKYIITIEYCSGDSFHEMLHAMMAWQGLDLMRYDEIDDHQLSLQIALHYSRFPKHSIINNIDKDMKPYL